MKNNEKPKIGIIGGTGLYTLMEDAYEIQIKTKYGEPSDKFKIGYIGDIKVVFLSRHGKGHRIPPHELPFHANINGFEQLGVKRIISCCAVGSLREDYQRGDVVIPDDFIDFGKETTTFYGTGDVTHMSFGADPFCGEIRRALINTCKNLKIKHHEKGIYVRIGGPRFSTKAESMIYRKHADIIGMTGVSEAILAREREICLGILSTVTDYDVGVVKNEKPVTTEEILNTMKENEEKVKRIIREVVNKIPEERNCICKDALKGAKV